MSSVPSDADRPIPSCPKCREPHVVRIYTAGSSARVQCFACRDCGHLFAIRLGDEESLPTA